MPFPEAVFYRQDPTTHQVSHITPWHENTTRGRTREQGCRAKRNEAIAETRFWRNANQLPEISMVEMETLNAVSAASDGRSFSTRDNLEPLHLSTLVKCRMKGGMDVDCSKWEVG